MSSSKERRVPSRAWLGVAAITLGVGTVLTPAVANANPSTPGNPSGSGSSEPSGSTGQPKPNSNTAEENISHSGTPGTEKCSKPAEECMRSGEMVGAGQDTVPAGLGNSTIVGGTAVGVGEPRPGAAPVPGVGPGGAPVQVGAGQNTVSAGAGQDTVPAGLGNSTIVGGTAVGVGEPRPGAAPVPGVGPGVAPVQVGAGQNTVSAGAGQDTVPAGLGNSTIVGGTAVGAGEPRADLNGTQPVPTLGAGQDTVPGGLGNSTIVGGVAPSPIATQ